MYYLTQGIKAHQEAQRDDEPPSSIAMTRTQSTLALLPRGGLDLDPRGVKQDMNPLGAMQSSKSAISLRGCHHNDEQSLGKTAKGKSTLQVSFWEKVRRRLNAKLETTQGELTKHSRTRKDNGLNTGRISSKPSQTPQNVWSAFQEPESVELCLESFLSGQDRSISTTATDLTYSSSESTPITFLQRPEPESLEDVIQPQPPRRSRCPEEQEQNNDIIVYSESFSSDSAMWQESRRSFRWHEVEGEDDLVQPAPPRRARSQKLSVCRCCDQHVISKTVNTLTVTCTSGRHQYCADCIKKYIETWIFGQPKKQESSQEDESLPSESSAIPCLSARCSGCIVLTESLVQRVCTEKVWKMYQEKKFLKGRGGLGRMRSMKWCI